MSRTASHWRPPTEFAEYTVERPVARGAMGQVYLARDTVLARRVALKFLAAERPSAKAKQRLLVEARAAARVQHPNVAAVYRVGDLDGRLYIVSEFVEGRALDQVEMPMPVPRTLRLAIGIARGLRAAHQQDVLHRDLKPGNILLDAEDNPKLVDFGLAKLLDAGGPPSSDAVRRSGPRRAPEHAPTRDLAPPAGVPGRPLAVTIPPERGPAGGASGRALAPTLVPDLAPLTANDPGARGGLAPTLVPDTLESPDPAPDRGLTRAGAVMGTPDYMAPESWRGEPATAATDLFAVGAVLFELLTGRPPFADVPDADLGTFVQTHGAPPLARVLPGVDARLAAIVDRCLEARGEARFESAAALLAALEQLLHRDAAVIPEGNPYRGLAVFDAAHRGLFFGREPEIEALSSALAERPFLLVTGDSGAGKSSLCRAGVLPRLTEAEAVDGRRWATVSLSPGRRPLTRLATLLSSFSGTDPQTFRALIEEDSAQAAMTVQRALGTSRGVVCFVDQLEELVTQADPEEAAVADRFLRQLASGFPGLKLLATGRADFLTRLAGLPALGPLVPDHLFLLRVIDRDRLRKIVTGPAEVTGVRFESEALVAQIVEEAGQVHNGLPILQFALAQLWEQRDPERSVITAAAMDRIGGVTGALTQHADAVFEELVPARKRIARELLVRLVSDEGLRTAVAVDRLTGGDPERSAVLDHLVRARLVALADGAETVLATLAHEVLTKNWARLAQWLTEQTETRLLRERLSVAARNWTKLDEDASTLWSGSLLQQAREVSTDALNPVEQRFVRESVRRQRAQVRRRILIGLGVLVVLAAVWAEASLRSDRALRARIQDKTLEATGALERAAEANRRALDARQDMRSELQRMAPDAAEERWRDVQMLERSMQAELRSASMTLSSVFALAPHESTLRERLAEAAFRRARLARRRFDHERFRELLDEARAYDPTGGDLEDRFFAPGTLVLPTEGPEGTVRLERYVRSGSRTETEPVELGPGRRHVLPVGSYRLTVDAPGRVRLRLPFQVTAGTRVAPALRAPAVERVPRGFVFVPGGPFVFGSTADDEARLGFFTAPPAHSVSSEPFLIGRHEVTLGAWLAFLDDQPAEWRRTWTQALVDDEGVTTGDVGLRKGSDGRWRLEFHGGGHTYRVSAGEPFVYRGRDRNVSQDWLRFPAMAVSAEDARRYTAWLDRTGRVPGARLCTEHEWERAARGADARPYPHGIRLGRDDANFDRAYAQVPEAMGPDEVGRHPASRSPFGVDDLVGNVWEWTTSVQQPDQYVLRGGSYFYDAKTNRATNRQVAVPSLRVASVGLRVCADAPEGD